MDVSDSLSRLTPPLSALAPHAGNDDPTLPKPVGRGQRLVVTMAILALFLLPGLIGHDPWKQDETYITEIVRHMLESGDWTVPTMAGVPFMEKPPLFYWVAAACAALFSPLLPLHDGARLACAIFVAVTALSVAWIGKRWWGQGRTCLLILLSCLGMARHAHFMLTDLAMLTGFAVAMCGLALFRERWQLGGMLFGTGVGMGFLGKGLFAPGVLVLCALLLPILSPHWRNRNVLRALALSLVAAAPWLLIWPLFLLHRSPQLFMDWLWLNNIGRFVGFSVPQLGATHSEWFWLMTLPWFAFPALPLALVSVWRQRASAWSKEPFQIAVLLTITLMLVLWQSASARDNYALPLLLPVSLLAAPVAASLPASVARLWDWSARIVFAAIVALIWCAWLWMMARGVPPRLPLLADFLPLEFAPRFDASILLAALALTTVALLLARTHLGFAGRGLRSWFTGTTLAWGLLSTLWLPWIDAAKSYRSVFNSVNAAMIGRYDCLAEIGMGESELSMLSYFLGVKAVSAGAIEDVHCDMLLINGSARHPPVLNDPIRWHQIWQGARPGDRNERFWLFVDLARATENLPGTAGSHPVLTPVLVAPLLSTSHVNAQAR